jgi:hypothetical protein
MKELNDGIQRVKEDSRKVSIPLSIWGMIFIAVAMALIFAPFLTLGGVILYVLFLGYRSRN